MKKLNPISLKVTKTLKNIPIIDLFEHEEIILIPQDSQNDGEIYVATNPNSTDVRTAVLEPTITGLVTNQYDVTDSGSVTIDDILYPYYTPTDPTGIIVGESIIINDGTDTYATTVHSIDSGDVILEPIEDFTPANTDLLIFNHSVWYYITSSIDKVAVGDKFQIVLDDDASIQIVEVVFKDATHIGFTISTTNYTSSDIITFQSDMKLDAFASKIKSNDFPNGLLIKHATTDSIVVNLTIAPAADYNRLMQFFF